MTQNEHITVCRKMVAKVAAAQLDHLSTGDRIMVCHGIASLYPAESSEARAAMEHAEALRGIEHQQLLLTSLLQA